MRHHLIVRSGGCPQCIDEDAGARILGLAKVTVPPNETSSRPSPSEEPTDSIQFRASAQSLPPAGHWVQCQDHPPRRQVPGDLLSHPHPEGLGPLVPLSVGCERLVIPVAPFAILARITFFGVTVTNIASFPGPERPPDGPWAMRKSPGLLGARPTQEPHPV